MAFSQLFSATSWADAVEETVQADISSKKSVNNLFTGQTPALTAQAELDMLADTSRDGLNLAFRNVRKRGVQNEKNNTVVAAVGVSKSV